MWFYHYWPLQIYAPVNVGGGAETDQGISDTEQKLVSGILPCVR